MAARIDANRLGRRAKARSLAAEVAAVAESVIQDPGSGADAGIFWAAIAEDAAARIGKVLQDDGPRAAPMTDQEARRFEQNQIPYGKFAGSSVYDVAHADERYLDMLVNSEFQRELRRYLASPYYRIPRGLGT